MKADELTRIPPLPGGKDENERRKVTRQRLRLLTARWLDDAVAHRKKHFDEHRDAYQGPTDLSTNFLLAVTKEISKLYAEQPDASNDEASADAMLEEVTEGGWWQLAQRHERYVRGMRESLVRPTWTPEAGYVFRLVTPDMVFLESSPDDPDRIIYSVEARTRIYKSKEVWTWDVADVRESEPTFRILLPRDEREPLDITADILGMEPSGADYPWVDAAGLADVPYALYHAERTGMLWDYLTGSEIVDGTLTIAVLSTFADHAFRDCSFPQRWIAGGSIKGLTGAAATNTKQVTVDPSMVVQIGSDGGDTVSVGQWNPGADPKMLQEVIAMKEKRLGVHYDLGGDDFKRVVESGYAISLKRSAVREAQRKAAPQFRRGDQQLLRLCAILQNRSAGTSYPEMGYHVEYQGLPQGPEEIAAELEAIEKRIAMKVANRVDAYLLDHNVTREEAVAELLKLDAETAKIQTTGSINSSLAQMGMPPVMPG